MLHRYILAYPCHFLDGGKSRHDLVGAILPQGGHSLADGRLSDHIGVRSLEDEIERLKDDIDTDQIIPKLHLRTIKRTGLGTALFAELRYDENGKGKSVAILIQRDNGPVFLAIKPRD